MKLEDSLEMKVIDIMKLTSYTSPYREENFLCCNFSFLCDDRSYNILQFAV